MSIKLLPASSTPVDLSPATDVSTSLVLVTQRSLTTRPRQISLVPAADIFARSSSTRRSNSNRINGTPVEDSQSDETSPEYVSGWAWSSPLENTAIAHYLSYATGSPAWIGRLINLYA